MLTRVHAERPQLGAGRAAAQLRRTVLGQADPEPSDNPYGASRAIDLQSQLDGLSSYTESVQDGISWSEAGERRPSRTSATSSSACASCSCRPPTAPTTPSDLANISTEVDQLTEAIKQDANTQYAGQYVFSGTLTSTLSLRTGAKPTNTRATPKRSPARSARGARSAVNTDISSLLGNGKESKDGKLLDVLRTIAAAPRRRHRRKARRPLDCSDLKALDANMEGLIELQAVAGSATDQLQTAATRIETLAGSITKTLSNTQRRRLREDVRSPTPTSRPPTRPPCEPGRTSSRNPC